MAPEDLSIAQCFTMAETKLDSVSLVNPSQDVELLRAAWSYIFYALAQHYQRPIRSAADLVIPGNHVAELSFLRDAVKQDEWLWRLFNNHVISPHIITRSSNNAPLTSADVALISHQTYDALHVLKGLSQES